MVHLSLKSQSQGAKITGFGSKRQASKVRKQEERMRRHVKAAYYFKGKRKVPAGLVFVQS